MSKMKPHVAPSVETPAAAPLTEPHPSSATMKLLLHLRPKFQNYVGDFSLASESRAALAPRFMKVFHLWQKDTGSTFVAFVRTLDPSIPEDRDGYRSHPSYQAAEHLKSLGVEGEQTPGKSTGPVPATPLEACGAILAAVLPLVSDREKLATALRRRLHWSEGQVTRALTMAEESKPLLQIAA